MAIFLRMSLLSSSLRFGLLCWGSFLWLFACRERSFEYEDAQYRVTRLATMPPIIDEGSGLALADDTTTFWTLNDGGGKTELYKVDWKGKLQGRVFLKGVHNIDWEELAKDPAGNLYIGDFGNNWSYRQNLCIYRVTPDRVSPDRVWRDRQGQLSKIDSLLFRYADQMDFPPLFKSRNFDCEAFFWYRDSLYLFSKNWSGKPVKLYRIPAQPGNHVAHLLDQAYLDPQAVLHNKKIQVTAADLSPDGKQFALLTYSTIYLFDVREGQINFRHPAQSIPIGGRLKQAEALVFINATDLVFSNEEGDLFLARSKRHTERKP